jgi:N-acetyl-anhydromuramyl-L-alanine amidase AmpD
MRRLLPLLLAACSPPAPPEGPLAQSIRAAAERNGVSRDLMVAVAHIEGGLMLPRVRFLRADDDVPTGGVLELRHGAFNSLARGAELMGTSEETLRIDTDLGTEAGARVLRELGPDWRQAVMQLSGHADYAARADYARRVFQLLHDGGNLPGREGEIVLLPAHPEQAVDGDIGVSRQAVETPDFPGAEWFTTSCTNKCTPGRPDGDASVDIIVIHDTEGGWDASVATLQNDSGKSVHYIVSADGKRVGQFRHETDTTWHAGNFEYNKHSIGIEHVGFASNTSGYSVGEYQTSVELVRSIRNRWKVPLNRTHIIGHYQIPDGTVIAESSPPCTAQLDTCETSANYGGAANHRDPGYHWDWCQYMERLGGSCPCADAWPLWNCTTDHTEAVRCVSGNVEIDHCDAGCDSMPVGTNDVCNHAAPMPSTQPSTQPSTEPSTEPSTVPASHHVAKGPPDPPASGIDAGCSVGGRVQGGWMWLIVLAALGVGARPSARSRARRR